MRRPKKILFLCVHNSARSQLAQAIARHLAPSGVTVISAGSQPRPIQPEVIRVLEEAGIASDGLYSKSIRDIDTSDVDMVITLCEEEICPFFPRPVQQIHWALPDPAAEEKNEAERLESFRKVLDELQGRLKLLLQDGDVPGQRREPPFILEGK